MDTYEKKYKEALEKARQLCVYPTTKPFISDLQDLFPELKESEDEKIRKGIKSILEHYKESGEVVCPYPFVSIDEALAWLEKQGEQKPILDFKAKDWYVSKVDGKIHNIYHSVDKVEPKFKVGDWLVHNNERKHIIKVVNPTPLVYEVVNILGYHHTITNTAIENNYHLWTIQDAKDGDVLASKDKEDILIYKSHSAIDLLLTSHVSFNKKEGFCPRQYSAWDSNEFIPATKEQRDLLFQKMHEAGYEWDAEKKELKKIEQNPAWSEEDEEIINLACSILYSNFNENENFDKNQMCIGEIIEKLKSLKDRIQPKQEWSEKDEEKINSICNIIADKMFVQKQAYKSYYKNLIDWLKSLKDKV